MLRSERWLIALLLLLLTALLYGRVLTAPFVQDDWLMLDRLSRSSFFHALGWAFTPAGKILYRPLGVAYFLLLYGVFGLSTVPFHLLALLLHACSSLLVVAIVAKLLGRALLAVSSGILYASAATVHIEPLTWMVGFYDVGSMFFGLAGFALFLRGRRVLSAVSIAIGLLIKESCISMLAVTVLYAIVIEPRKFRPLIPHAVVLLLYAAAKIAGVSPLGATAAEPYRAGLLGSHISSNALSYYRWMMETILPQTWIPSRLLPGIGIIALAGVALALLWKRALPPGTRPRMIAFLAGWLILGILPVLPLQQQIYRYYLLNCLVPAFVLLLFLAESVVSSTVHRYGKIILTFVLAAYIFGGWSAIAKMEEEGAGQLAVFDGTNHLFRKGAIVSRVRTQMLSRYPRLTRNAALVLPQVDVRPFGGSIGPQLWYGDTTLTVFTRHEYDSLLVASKTLEGRPVYIITIDLDTPPTNTGQ